MSESKKKLLIIPFILLILVCSLITFVGYRLLEYDPKEAALETVTQCVNAEDEQQQESCGLITDLPCWNAIKQSADTTNDQYSVDILWYNWEDEIPNRGGDEVYLQVTFSDGNIFRILWYEGWLEYCEYNAQ
jgi:hypothetical protein